MECPVLGSVAWTGNPSAPTPQCKSVHIHKNGHKRGKQNYLCVDCRRQFIDCYESERGYEQSFKQECLTMYVNGMGLRAIERVKGG
jgi:transposase-like protein